MEQGSVSACYFPFGSLEKDGGLLDSQRGKEDMMEREGMKREKCLLYNKVWVRLIPSFVTFAL